MTLKETIYLGAKNIRNVFGYKLKIENYFQTGKRDFKQFEISQSCCEKTQDLYKRNTTKK